MQGKEGESNRAKDRPRVNLGLALTQELKDAKGSKTEAEMAFLLLDKQ